MDAEVLGRLPEDILPHILLHLPWWSIMKLRAVSKSWHSLLSNPTFLSKSVSTRGARDEPCAVVSNPKFYYAIANPAIQRCHVIPPENIIPMDHPEAKRFELRATAGGLFLMQVEVQCKDRFLFNPLNGARKLLPPVPPSPLDVSHSTWNKFHQPRTWMMLDDTGSLRIVCLQVRETPAGYAETVLWNIHVYEFASNSWHMYSSDLPGRRLEFCRSVALVNDNLYLLAKSQYSHENVHRLFRAYSRHLVEVPINFTDGSVSVRVFQHRGVLMLMTGTEEPRMEPYHVRLWKYDEHFGSWENLVSMPQNIVDAFYEGMSRDGGFCFDVEGDVCCFGNRLESEYIVLYHLLRNEWWHVSCCSDKVHNDFESLRAVFRHTFLWQPRVDLFL